MFSGTGRFGRTDRILRSGGFRRVLADGKRFSSRNFVIFVAVDLLGSGGGRSGRIGITVSKRVGNSVARNYLKRRIREWYRSVRQNLPMGTEIVVIARQPSCDLATGRLFSDLNQVISKYQMATKGVNWGR